MVSVVEDGGGGFEGTNTKAQIYNELLSVFYLPNQLMILDTLAGWGGGPPTAKSISSKTLVPWD